MIAAQISGLSVSLAMWCALVVVVWMIAPAPRPRHRPTDPACTRYRPAQTVLGARLHDTMRGRSCPVCMDEEARQ